MLGITCGLGLASLCLIETVIEKSRKFNCWKFKLPLFFYAGLPKALHWWKFHGAQWSSPLLASLSLQARHSVRWLRKAHHRPLHLCYGSQVSPRALCVCLLSAAAQPGHLQGAERETILLSLLWQTLCLRFAHEWDVKITKQQQQNIQMLHYYLCWV